MDISGGEYDLDLDRGDVSLGCRSVGGPRFLSRLSGPQGLLDLELERSRFLPRPPALQPSAGDRDLIGDLDLLLPLSDGLYSRPAWNSKVVSRQW